MKYAVSIFLVFTLLAQCACSTDQVVSSLELTVDSVSAALPLIGPAAGLPADLQAQIQDWIGSEATKLASASDILSSTATDAVKAFEIVALALDQLPPSVPAKFQAIAAALHNIAILVSKFLANLPTAAPASASPAGSFAFTAPAKTKSTKLSASDRRKLAAIRSKALAAAAAANKK